MKTITAVLACLVAASMVGCTSAESYSRKGYDFARIDKVAVVHVAGGVESAAVRSQIADYYVMELLEKGYSPIDLSQVQKVVEEKFQTSEISCDAMYEIGEKLDARALLYVNIHKLGQDVSMTAKMVDAEHCSILWMGSGESATGNSLYMLGGKTVKQSTEEDGQMSVRVLTDREEKAVRNVVRQICGPIPARSDSTD